MYISAKVSQARGALYGDFVYHMQRSDFLTPYFLSNKLLFQPMILNFN